MYHSLPAHIPLDSHRFPRKLLHVVFAFEVLLREIPRDHVVSSLSGQEVSRVGRRTEEGEMVEVREQGAFQSPLVNSAEYRVDLGAHGPARSVAKRRRIELQKREVIRRFTISKV